ncbi:hypothetical protein TEA_004652 [Camellia sinensis var. sinensis]|uniref:Uncharacterized protein n=1 Tax=Camellia sinensis var. sinensis TaxID=542762 RepID=A0A4S4EBE2_CAMSN|nr:hypothetical protein TEA_004652 [Camellia sinensis var. sinensis]
MDTSRIQIESKSEILAKKHSPHVQRNLPAHAVYLQSTKSSLASSTRAEEPSHTCDYSFRMYSLILLDLGIRENIACPKSPEKIKTVKSKRQRQGKVQRYQRGPRVALPDFQFETIPDGLPPLEADSTQDIPSLSESTSKNCMVPFRNLLSKLNGTSTSTSTSTSSSPSDVPPVTCIVSDGCMSFTLKAALEFGVPEILFWTPSACGFLAYTHYKHLVERGLVPLKEFEVVLQGSSKIFEFSNDVLEPSHTFGDFTGEANWLMVSTRSGTHTTSAKMADNETHQQGSSNSGDERTQV